MPTGATLVSMVLGSVALLAIVGGGLYMLHDISYKDGYAKCQLDYIQAQKTQTDKVIRHDTRIDQHTPFSANKRTAINWLSKYTTSNGY